MVPEHFRQNTGLNAEETARSFGFPSLEVLLRSSQMAGKVAMTEDSHGGTVYMVYLFEMDEMRQEQDVGQEYA